MKELLQLFEDILIQVKNPKQHPLVNTYNPIKCSLLIYEICFKIKNKNVFTLQ